MVPRHPLFLKNKNKATVFYISLSPSFKHTLSLSSLFSFPPSFPLSLTLSLSLSPSLFLYHPLSLSHTLSLFLSLSFSLSLSLWLTSGEEDASRKCRRALSIPHSVSQSVIMRDYYINCHRYSSILIERAWVRWNIDMTFVVATLLRNDYSSVEGL